MIHKDLKIWQRGIALVTEVYRVTENYPAKEIFGMTNQMRRAAYSIPMNIAEGSARSTLKEYIHFLHIALGSIAELDTQLIISKNLNFIDDQAMLKLSNELTELSKMTSSLIRNLETRLPNSKPAAPNP